MAWLSGLAGKAENLLNKIDQNTAAVLNKEKNGIDGQLMEVKWVSPDIRTLESINDNSPFITENVVKSPEMVSQTDNVMHHAFVEIVPAPKVPSVKLEHTNYGDSDSEISLQSGRSSPSSTHHSVDMFTRNNKSTDASSEECNIDITNEVANSSVSAINHRISAVQRELVYRLPDTDEYYSVIKKKLEDKNDQLNKQQTDYQKEINTLKESQQSFIAEKRQFLREISDLKSNLERNKLEIESIRSELDQHKARASKTLQEKEKLIAELRSNSSNGFDESAAMEINQLTQEKESFREENQQIYEQLKLTRQELLLTDSKLEKIKIQTQEAKIQAQEMINMEKRRRLDAEEDAKHHSEEIRSLKEEIVALRRNFSSKSQRQEGEISRLRSQISAMSTPSTEIETRLSSLTQTLVSKQQALETLTTERNALRLQLEKIEQEYRMLGNMRRNVSYNSVNDTDDAKAQVPTFLVETPFDTGVTKRVKRVYSTLDAISIRTGVFLRRYPLARILAILQFWVLFILFFAIA